MEKKQIINDIILIAVCMLIAGFLYLAINILCAKKGKYVKVQAYGEEIVVLSLENNTTYEYDFDGNKNIIIIKDGEVFVSEANCNNNECVNQGSISKEGQSIICLPHKLVISIVGDNDEKLDGMVR